MSEPTVAERAAVIKALEAEGYTILRTRSYHAARERQRVAEALFKAEKEHSESVRAWAHRAFDEQRQAWARTTYLYGLAARLGATDQQLAGPTKETP